MMARPGNSAAAGRILASARALRRLAVRLALCVPLGAALAAPAAAGDLLDDSFLRGSFSAGPVRWDGVYLGAEIGYSNLHVDFANSNASLDAFGITVPNVTTNGTSYGGFLGYNYQIEPDLVIGFEFGYTQPSSLSTSSTASGGGATSTATYKLVDFGTARLRAGYAFGQFLPYAAIGLAIGRFDYSILTTSGGSAIQDEHRDNAYSAGVAAALGVDVALLPNVFLRAEWEYIYFSALKGITSDVNTFRAGLAVRF